MMGAITVNTIFVILLIDLGHRDSRQPGEEKKAIIQISLARACCPGTVRRPFKWPFTLTVLLSIPEEKCRELEAKHKTYSTGLEGQCQGQIAKS